VATIIAETPTVKTFRLRLSDSAPIPFSFAPGQFLSVSFLINGARVARSYSIASSPTQRDYVELTVKRDEHGVVSCHLHDDIKVGEEIEISGPVGRFTFTGEEAESIVLIAGGVGITPMMSIIRYLTDRVWPGEIYLVYSCRSPVEFVFRSELALLQHKNPRLRVIATMSRVEEGSDWMGLRGRISKDLLAQTIPDIATRRVHICGPPPMLDAVKKALAELGIAPDHIRTETFGAPSKANPPVSVAARPAAPPVPATGPLVTFSRSDKSARIHDGKTVLELADELGVIIENSCRVGTCGTCKVKLLSGQVTMEVDEALEPTEKASGIILACQAKPCGDVEVEA
jgi:ferredoxin-NADP reductase